MANKWETLKYTNIFPTGVIKTLDKALDTITNAVTLLTKITKFLQMFISAFNSFSVILQTFVSYAQKQLSQYTSDLAGAGVYINVLVPPAFLKGLMDNEAFSHLSSGGFEGFLQRLRVSLYNTADKNAPSFSDKAQVGGFIILLDTETLYDFYRGLNFINGMFSFMDIFPLNTSPMPPRNLRGISGYFEQPDKTYKLGIKLTWDAPNVKGFTSYRISRSKKSGGIPVESRSIPTKLVGSKGHEEEGLITASMIRLFGGDKQWPSVLKMEYNDPTFNGGKPISIDSNPVNGGGAYIDYNSMDSSSNSKYYYVVESGFASSTGDAFGIWGPKSPEVGVPVFPKCISENQAGVAIHADNKLELITVGSASLGQWSAIQVKAILPFLPAVIDLLNKFVASLGGALKTNTKSFSDFLRGIQQGFQRYKDFLDVISTMIIAIENFFSGAPTVRYLNVPAESGGVDGFLKRVVNAKRPDGGFSGKSGFTAGIVFVYGEGATSDALGSNTVNFKEQIKALSKAFDVIMRLLS